MNSLPDHPRLRHIALSKQLGRYTDTPYALGGPGGKGGWDCLSLVLDFLAFLGYPVPDEFGGFTRDNYAERWRQGEGRAELLAFLRSLGNPIDRTFARPGDIMVFNHIENGKENPWGGLYCGNGQVLTAFAHGVRVVQVAPIEQFLVEVRRCL